MKIKNLAAAMLFMAGAATVAPSCKSKPKDPEIKTAVEAALSSVSGVLADVKEGTVTLSGTVADEAAKLAAEASAKAVAGVAGVVNNLTVAPPAIVAPVVVAVDDALSKGIADVVKVYSGVKADVKDGIVTLSGDITKAKLASLMQAVMALKPKKVDNKLTVK